MTKAQHFLRFSFSDKATEEELRLMMPKDLYQYCEEHNLLKSLVKN